MDGDLVVGVPPAALVSAAILRALEPDVV